MSIFEVGGSRRDLSTTALVMGILNRTPDSFYDKGSYFEFDSFLKKVDTLVGQGADIVDIGGVKAGPGLEVSLEEELERVVPAVEAVATRHDVLISVDTWNADVLGACMSVGAHIGNDISGFADDRYLTTAAAHKGAVVATHIRLSPRVRDPEPIYDDLLGNVEEFLLERYRRAVSAGLSPSAVALDAGFDLGKTTPQSLALLGATERLAAHGLTVLISASNKTFLGESLELELKDRTTASISAVALSYLQGARIFRVHNVRATRRVIDTLGAIMEPERFDRHAGDGRSVAQ